jgi:diguanylate cyclase (GGDEF)-like protein/PAS domain S-box-containing protein
VSADSREAVRVLLVEDDEGDYIITREMLANQERARFEVEWSAEYAQALEAIREQRHDVYLVDYRLGERTGLELVREGFASRPFAPVIMLTGQPSYEVDLEATALGVTDFLVKQELDPGRLERSVRYAISHQQAERYAQAVRAANDGIWDWDLLTDRIYFSPRWHTILGQPEEAGDDTPEAWFELIDGDGLVRLRAAIKAHLGGNTPHLECEHRMRHADGSWRWVMTRGIATRDANGTPIRMAGSLSDMTDRRIAQLRLERDARHDTLTALPNRTLFVDRLDAILERCTRDPSRGCAVLFLDLDDFKPVNDTFSHAVGDQLLIVLAERIQGALRPGDTVARLGGDEFTVLLDQIVDAADAKVIADRVLRSLDDAFNIDGNQLQVSASIGIALSSPGLESATLIANADLAMYDAKHHGRARTAIFDESMERGVVDRLHRQEELHQVVEDGLLRIHYQPIVELATGRVCAFEALARWPEDWPPVAPAEFISIAEESGVIGKLGQHVMRTALQALARWRRDGLVSDDVCVSVNLSRRQLDDPALAGQVRAAIESAALPADALKLEITESTLMELDPSQSVFAEICPTGVGLYLDDFGTGYTSLADLHRLPVDALKLDRQFVSMLSEGDGGEAIARSTCALADSLGRSVIAEGIEAPDQLRRARSLGCDRGQGDLISPALGEQDTRRLLENWRPTDLVDLGTVA